MKKLTFLKMGQASEIPAAPPIPGTEAGPPVAPGGGGAPAVSSGGEGGTGVASNKAVLEMQTLLVNIGKDINSHEAFAGEGTPGNIANPASGGGVLDSKPSVAAPGNPSPTDGADAFGNFLVSQYISPDDPKDPNKNNGTRAVPNMREIMKSIQGVGASVRGQETRPDGVWGKNTSAALAALAQFAPAVSKMASSIDPRLVFTPASLATLVANSKDPGQSLTNEERAKRATALIPALSDFRTFFQNFRDKILNSPNYGQILTQQKPLLKMKKNMQNTFDHSKSLDQAGQATYNANLNNPIKIDVGNFQATITPADLHSLDAFKQYVTKNSKIFTPEEVAAVQRNDPKYMTALLQSINQQLGTS